MVPQRSRLTRKPSHDSHRFSLAGCCNKWLVFIGKHLIVWWCARRRN